MDKKKKTGLENEGKEINKSSQECKKFLGAFFGEIFEIGKFQSKARK